MLRLSEPKFRILDVFLTLALKIFEPKETRSQILLNFLHFYNKISSNFALNFNFLLIHIKF
jgi:hypothetical protein